MPKFSKICNNLLKFGEGISQLFRNFFKSEAKKSILTLLGLLLLKPSFKRFKRQFDYDEYGGAHFLGVNGINGGHELGHKTDHPLKVFLAHVLLMTSLQNHFMTYHNSGHHRDVASPNDLTSAK